ncbi:MAG TPA: hypothetical protein VKV39_19735 [Candidatus Sulfotelmatobacter sp.]|nr:hypothetical protein [Candidatus Sulfotelmatobacter sp.]
MRILATLVLFFVQRINRGISDEGTLGALGHSATWNTVPRQDSNLRYPRVSEVTLVLTTGEPFSPLAQRGHFRYPPPALLLRRSQGILFHG